MLNTFHLLILGIRNIVLVLIVVIALLAVDKSCDWKIEILTARVGGFPPYGSFSYNGLLCHSE